MKKELLMAALAAISSVCLMAQTDPYVVEIADAVWNFDDYSDTKSVIAGNENFVCPQTWFVGNAGSRKASAAYLPFIYPSKLDKDNSYGYDGRLCERIYGIASDGRVPVYAILPAIKDKAYENLVLTFYGKGEPSIISTPYYANLRIGYLADIADTAELKDHFAEKVILFKDTTLSQTEYNKYEISLTGIPANAHVVFYDDDVTKVNSCLLDNISFTEVKAGPDTAQPNTEAEGNTAKKIVKDGRLYILRSGMVYDALGNQVH